MVKRSGLGHLGPIEAKQTIQNSLWEPTLATVQWAASRLAAATGRPSASRRATTPAFLLKKLASSTSMLPPEAAITDPAATSKSCAYQVGKNGHEQDSRRSFVYVVFPWLKKRHLGSPTIVLIELPLQ
jgi:hypothetical protein